MKRIISLILALGIISSNLTTVFAQDAASALHNRMKLYEIWPGLFAEDINKYVAKSEQYLLAKPSASQAELDAMTKSLRESENLINKVLKANLANDDFIYDLYNSLAIADNRYSSKSRFSLMYTKNAVNALSSGQTPRSAATVLKDTPDFFNKIAKDILDKSSMDFEFLVNKIQKTFNMPRVKAVSLALSAEIQYAQSLLGGRIAALRGRIARNKVLIRKAGARADRQVTAWRREISNAQKELLDLKRIYDDPFRTLLYSVGDEGIDNIVSILNTILKKDQKTMVLLETMAGKGTEIGRNFEEIAKIISKVDLKDKVGVCLDTCHVYDGGYDIVNQIDEVLSEFDRIISLDKLKAIHLNNSLYGFASHKDRHENLGKGYIGFDILAQIVHHPRLDNITKILETPYIDGKAPYKEEIEQLRAIKP